MAEIRTIGVCGAGVMGSQLAAFFASAGFEVCLYDLSRELVEKGLQSALTARPPAFYLETVRRKIITCAYDENLDRLTECDWIIEAIAERVDWKRDLYARIEPRLKPEAVLTSNTSGLSLRELVEEMGADARERFLITHFFNLPRYMRLVEFVVGPDTRDDVRAQMEEFVGETLGKGVVYARDTPNFIANRIGVYGMMLALRLTEKMRLSVEQVDALTGPVMGRPKSATYRTADLVGLDTLSVVAQTTYEKCPDDESRELFRTPAVVATLMERGSLGQKSGQGFYRKEGEEILALDLRSLEYHPSRKPRMDGLRVAGRFTDLGRKIHALAYNPDTAGEFAWELAIGTLAYAARRMGEVVDDIVSVDRAMRWGFGWQMGPFEVWDALGVEKSVQRMRREGKAIPELVEKLLESGRKSFYERKSGGVRHYFDVASGTTKPVPVAEGMVSLADEKARGRELLHNWSASLVDIGDGVACVEFHSPLQPDFNPIDGAILDMLERSLRYAGDIGLKGLVISHEGIHFCAGANLALILERAKARQFSVIETISRTFQDITQAIRYSPFPVVAAPFSVCLGGGFEIVAPCRQIVTLSELYCGAVEVGVGLIPGAGGNLRLLTHLAERMPPQRMGPMPFVQKAFETIAFARVSGSAHEAVELGYLREDNIITLSRDHQIARAKQTVLELSESYAPPKPRDLVLPGEGGRLALESAVENLLKAGTISEHDALIARSLARVLTGGDRANGMEPVDEQYLLDLERETFVRLAQEPLSQARMAHMLKTGKPLRN